MDRDNVYVLRLRGGNWYIGYTRNLGSRVAAHKQGRGAAWTRLHPVIDVERIYNGNEEAEREVTLAYMKKYGVDKVRGGCWSQVDIQYLPQDLVANYSYKGHECGYYGHASNACPTASQSQSYQSSEENSDSDSGSIEFCVRCGRNNHVYKNCRASYTVDSVFIGNDDCCSRCGRNNNWNRDCFAKVDIWGYRL